MEISWKYCVLLLIFLLFSSSSVDTFTKFTNIDCKALDKPFADFKSCRLYVPKRGEIALSVHVRLFQIPVNNVSCCTLDKKFADFSKCGLSVPNRGEIAMAIHVKLFQIPVNNASINLSFFKKASGYRPFLYNVTADFCAFMANKKRYPFLNIFFDILLRESNINHTCPYNHDIIVKNLILRDDMFGRIPVPAGEYMFKLMVGAYNDWKADVKAYFSIRLNKKER